MTNVSMSMNNTSSRLSLDHVTTSYSVQKTVSTNKNPSSTLLPTRVIPLFPMPSASIGNYTSNTLATLNKFVFDFSTDPTIQQSSKKTSDVFVIVGVTVTAVMGIVIVIMFTLMIMVCRLKKRLAT